MSEKKADFVGFLKEKRSKKLHVTGVQIAGLTILYHEQWQKMEEMSGKWGVFRDNIVPRRDGEGG